MSEGQERQRSAAGRGNHDKPEHHAEGSRPKRHAGEGTFEILPSGKYRTRVMVGYRRDGKPDRRSITAKSERELVRKANELRRRAEAGLMADPQHERETLGSFLEDWLNQIVTRVRSSTVARYRILVHVHIVPALGRVRMRDLRVDAINSFYAERQVAGLSPTTVRLIHTVLRKALSDAVDYGYLGSNPAARAKPPRRADFEAVPPTPDEAKRLLEAAETSDDRLGSLWTVLFVSGARIGELLALRWEDVAWDRSSLTIRRSLVAQSGAQPEFEPPKTARGRRVVGLGQAGLESLRKQRVRQSADKVRLGEAYADHGLVFATSLGTALSERNVIRSFKTALRRAGLRSEIRIHDLRHYHITTAAHSGVSVKALSTRVGHASVAFTLDRYAHHFEAGDQAVADAVERSLNASGELASADLEK